MFAEKSVIFNLCEILFQIKDDLYKKFGDGVINRVSIMSKVILRIQCGWKSELQNLKGFHEAMIGVQIVHAKDIV